MVERENNLPEPEDLFLCGYYEDNPEFNMTFAYLGKQNPRLSGRNLAESKNIFIDCNESHVVLICGKKGSGKSYTMGVFVEELTKIMTRFPDKLSIVIVDTMGTFLGMGKENDELTPNLSNSWNINPKGFDVIKIYVPSPTIEKINERRRQFKYSPDKITPLYLRPGDLDPQDFVFLANWDINQPSGALLLESAIDAFTLSKEVNGTIEALDIDDIINSLYQIPEQGMQKHIRNVVHSKLKNMKTWNLFSTTGPTIRDFVEPGKISILDLSLQGISSGVSLDSLFLSIFTRKIYQERMITKKTVAQGREDRRSRGIPNVWLVIDEAHKYLESNSYSKNDLKRWVQQGRAPGLGTIMATQNPGRFPDDIITNMDVLIAHKLITKNNIEKVKKMAIRTELDIKKLFEDLPEQKGSAVFIDTESSQSALVGIIRPRQSKHTGESESIIKK